MGSVKDSCIKDRTRGGPGRTRLLDTLLVHVGRITRSRAFRTVANANVARSNGATRSSTPAALARGSMIAITDVTGRLIGRDPSNRSIPPVITSNSRRCTRRRGVLQITRRTDGSLMRYPRDARDRISASFHFPATNTDWHCHNFHMLPSARIGYRAGGPARKARTI